MKVTYSDFVSGWLVVLTMLENTPTPMNLATEAARIKKEIAAITNRGEQVQGKGKFAQWAERINIAAEKDELRPVFKEEYNGRSR